MGLYNGDSWQAQMDLMDRWSAAGGTSNERFAWPFKREAEAMEARLVAAGITHPFDARFQQMQDGIGEGQTA